MKFRITFNDATERSYDLERHTVEHNGETVNIRLKDGNRSIAKWPARSIAAMYVS